MKYLLALLLCSASLFAADAAPKPASSLGFDQFALLFVIADKLDQAAAQSLQHSAQENDPEKKARLEGESAAYQASSKIVRDQIAAIRAIRKKQMESGVVQP